MSRTALDWLLVAIAIGAWVFAMGKAGESDLKAAQITAQHVQAVDAHRDLRHPCDGATIVQWGRYHEAKSEPRCAKGTSDPRNLFSVPCNLDAKTGRCR